MFKKITISAALAGTFAFASFIVDFEENVASAEENNTNQILRVGSKGSGVVNLQSKLKEQKHLNDKVDGIYGSKTKSAVVSFQRSKKLQADGIAGPKTLTALYGSSSAVSSAPKKTASVSNSTVLRNGSRGQAVSNLQTQLKNLNFFSSKVDGVYGPLTVNAVRSFQRANGLSADGIAGSQTFAALNGNPARSYESKTQVKSGISVNTSTLVNTAKSLIGTKYKWGGTTTSGFDCSGFLNYVYQKHGVSIPRTVSQIWSAGKSVSSPSVGDIVFFNTTGGASHAGIYLGNNQFIHSGTSTGVTISSLSNSYWKPRYLGAKSVF